MRIKREPSLSPRSGRKHLAQGASPGSRLRSALAALCALLLGGLLLLPGRAGSRPAPLLAAVRGRVELLNAKAKARDGRADAGGVVVWLAGEGGARPVRARRTLTQREKRFAPHVMAVGLGTEVDFPNEDPFFHNVFSVYNGKRFDLGLYASGETRPVLFNRPGVSFIFCNIHPQMSAVVVTLETPYFAVSGPDGGFAIADVPEGSYRLGIWHERSDPEQLSAQSRAVRVEGAGVDLGAIRLSEAGYIVRPHLDKHGAEYRRDRGRQAYGKP